MILTFRVFFLRLRVSDSYVWGIVLLRFGVSDCYVWGLFFLCFGVSNSNVSRLVVLRLLLVILPFGGK